MNLHEVLEGIDRREMIPAIMREHRCFDFVVEVGVCDGKQFRYFNSFKPYLLVGVDLWEGKYAGHRLGDEVMDRIRIDCPGCVLEKGISWEVADDFPDWMFDLVYIDAAHDYESVKKDIEAWWPKVGPGRVLAGHDYAVCEKNNFGVIEAVDEFVHRERLKLIVTKKGTRRKYKSWIVVKP